jgi:hypothetical protein
LRVHGKFFLCVAMMGYDLWIQRLGLCRHMCPNISLPRAQKSLSSSWGQFWYTSVAKEYLGW